MPNILLTLEIVAPVTPIFLENSEQFIVLSFKVLLSLKQKNIKKYKFCKFICKPERIDLFLTLILTS